MAVLLILGISGIRVPGGESPVSAVVVLDRSDSMAPFLGDALTRADALGEGMRRSDRVGLVTFGADAAVERRLDASLSIARTTAVSAGGTDIETALRTARTTLPRDGSRRVVLVSDGRQTTGDALKEAAFARDDGVRIDVVVPMAPSPAGRPIVTRVTAPSAVATGEPFDVVVTVEGPPGIHGEIVLSGEGAPAESLDVTIPPGGAARGSFREQQSRAGVYAYRAVFQHAPGDFDQPMDDGPASGVVVVVAGEPHVLRVGGSDGPLDAALVRRGFGIDRIAPGALSRSAAILSRYDAVILDDVRGDDLDARQSAALSQYVEQLGGGVLVLGSPRSLEPAFTANAALASLLPVDLRPRAGRRAPTTSIVVVFDKSGSMNDRVDGAPRIEYARQAVQQLLTAVPPTDLVGVIAFDAVPVAVAPLLAGHTPEAIGAGLRAVQPAGSTAIAPALELAARWLGTPEAARSATRHILLLSDGRTSAADADRARAGVEGRGIMVSVVALGDGSDRELLGALASRTGGRAYFPADVRQLPLLVAREATRVAGGRVVTESFAPRASRHPAVAGLDVGAMPRLGGYVVTAAKPSAEVALRSHMDDPVLAMSRSGLGKVAVYTADLNAPWSAGLRAWSGFEPLFAQTVRWTSRRTRDDDLFAHFEATDHGARLIVDAETSDGRFLNLLDTRASVRTPAGAMSDVVLTPSSPGRYQADIAMKEPGPYVMSIVARDRDAAFERTLVRGYYWSADREQREPGVDRQALLALARATGGQVLTGQETPFTIARDRASRDGVPWVAAAALILLLGALLTPAVAGIAARTRGLLGHTAARQGAA